MLTLRQRSVSINPRMVDTTKYDVFVSHSQKDLHFVQELTQGLEKRGIRVWYDHGALRAGDSFLRSIEDALEQSRFFVLVISPDYVLGQWSNFEMGVALSRSPRFERIIPVYARRVDRKDLPPVIANLAAIDASGQPVEAVAARVAETVDKDKQTVRQ